MRSMPSVQLDAGPSPDFMPALVRLQISPPSTVGRAILWMLIFFAGAFIAWAALGKLDIIAVADGKLVPGGYLKIVQPAEPGVVREILVREGQAVEAGQALMRMDTSLSEADGRALLAEFHARRLALRRIDAELAERPFARLADDPEPLYEKFAAQHAANRVAHHAALAQERSVLERAGHDLEAAQQVRSKIEQVLPHYREQEQAYEKLLRDGFAGRILATEKQRERIEKEQDLRTQDWNVRSAQALIEQSRKRVAQIGADYRRQLQAERVEAASLFERAQQELSKQRHRQGLLELRAPEAGTVKDLATHTAGTVVSPGTILMTLVPADQELRAEVWIGNADVGFVRRGQPARMKLATFQFQKYGTLEGEVLHVGADASENAGPQGAGPGGRASAPLSYKALVQLKSQHLEAGGSRHRLAPGMQVSAEINLGTRTVLEFLLSPIQKTLHEAGRER